ncbi:MAG: glycosyltransferase family 2 protein [Solirubrobacteraceae bacterium]
MDRADPPTADDTQLTLSVVVPVYGCSDCLAALHRRLTETLEPLGHSYELVFVEDRSPDESWAVLQRLASVDPSIRAIRLSRNFGQHAAITAGLANSCGRYTVVMDCDLQDPPELIPALLDKALEGNEVVLARRVSRSHSARRLALTRVYHWFLRTFLRTHISGEYGAFSLISAKVRRAFLTIPDKDRHYLHILFWLGFQTTSIPFEHRERASGKSSYSLGALIRHAVEGVFFQTTTLLRFIVYLGFTVAVTGVLLALYFIFAYIALRPPPGYTSLAVLILLVGGFTIVALGVTGLYIGQIFKQVKDRPIYVVDVDTGPVSSERRDETATLDPQTS